MAQLRPIFFHLYQAQLFNRLWKDVILLLSSADKEYNERTIVVRPLTGHQDNVRESLGYDLSLHLYGWTHAQSLRLRLSIADFCWVSSIWLLAQFIGADNPLLKKLSPQPEIQQSFGAAAQSLINEIMHHTMLTIIRHAKAALAVLGGS